MTAASSKVVFATIYAMVMWKGPISLILRSTTALTGPMALKVANKTFAPAALRDSYGVRFRAVGAVQKGTSHEDRRP